MSCRGSGMNVFPPGGPDRIIGKFPQCFRKEAALDTQNCFNNKVKTVCQEGRIVCFKISKVIVLGDMCVGKTCLINRFCKDTFNREYMATIGVDFDMARFEILGVPFSLQLWDTAGQERFKSIAPAYYRGAQVVIITFDVNDVASLERVRYWLKESLMDNDPATVQLFLVGTKKDLSSPAQYALIERDAIDLAKEICAEYWAISSLTGENVKEFFYRVAVLAFETNVLLELEASGSKQIGDIITIKSPSDKRFTKMKKRDKCCQ